MIHLTRQHQRRAVDNRLTSIVVTSGVIASDDAFKARANSRQLDVDSTLINVIR